jgi:glycolate oxidase iron-sulfur subunit
MNAPPSQTPPPPDRATLSIEPRAYQRGLACVHCGLCLPACPTYTQTGHEAESPRGRIQLMLGMAEGRIELSDTVKKHLDLCLDCRACETACPSGVIYHELIEETRARLAEQQKPPMLDRFMRWIFFTIFTRPRRLRLVLLPARLLQKAGIYPLLRKSGLFRLLPRKLRKMEQMLPADGSLWPRPLPEHSRAGGMDAIITLLHDGVDEKKPKATVGFFATCIGSVIFDKINRQAAELLAAAGADVWCPPAQVCCGAIHHHNGARHAAEAMARRNIDTFMPEGGEGVDYIVSTVAGCGAMLREYDVLLRDDPAYAERAKRFVQKVRDISEVLLALGLPEMRRPVPLTVTYHDACHLVHAQKVASAPRELLARVPGLKLVPLPEADMCCGAAGTYNLAHPEMATSLAERKLDNIARTGASVCATGNAGCSMHIQSESDARGRDITVVHPVEILHQALFGRE